MPAEVRTAYENLQAENQRLTQLLKLREEEIRLLHLEKWGPKADKLSEAQLTLLPLEPVVLAAEVEREADLPEGQKQLPHAKKPRPNHPGREPLPTHLKRVVQVIPCAPEDCRCPKCGKERVVIDHEIREELDCEPAQFFVRVIKREKRASCCRAEQGIAVAPAPLRIVPKSKLSNNFIIEVLAAKFQQHQPVYRQIAVLAEDHGFELSRQTLNHAMLRAAELLIPVTAAMASELRAGHYLQADETTVPCQTAEKSGRNHRAWLWEYSQPGGSVVFQFEMTRGRAGPKQFLQGFRGILQCDGYSAYDELGEGITFAGCMAHVRRGFAQAAKLAPEDPVPAALLREFEPLYAIEGRARENKLSTAERQALRQTESKPLLAALKTHIVEVRQQVTPGSKLAKACDYALGQWSRMEVYLEHGQVEIDNNWCEGAMRPIALGRKNWLHLGDQSAGPKIAAVISIVETCRRLDIPLREYLHAILPKLGHWPVNRVAELTPSRWKAAHSA